MAGKQVSKRKRSSNESATFASALKGAKRLEVDLELNELRAQNVLLMAEFAATVANKEAEVIAVIALKAQHAAQVAALTAQNTIQQSQIAKQTGMFGARVLISILSLSSRVFLVSARFLLSPTPSCVCLIFF